MKLFEGEGMDTGRRVLVALVAKKILDMIQDLSGQQEEKIRSLLGMNSDQFQEFLLDLVDEAVVMIKQQELKGK